MNGKKVLVAMSGGVDSTVCAHLIKNSGYITEGITMKLWSECGCVIDEDMTEPDLNCQDAKRVADQLDIPHTSVALGDSFRKKVIDKFIFDYTNGATPNPCVECNKHIKFGALMEIAEKKGFDFLATGHYARIEKDNDGIYRLKKAKDGSKDQSYFLWSIKKEYLSKILFPLGDYTKSEIRDIAKENKYESAHRSDSQDICFIPDGDYVSFIKKHTDSDFPAGNFISPDGKVLGKHSGIINYTIGQRKGLGVALGYPIFVSDKNVSDNTVTLCSDEELYKKELTICRTNIFDENVITEKRNFDVKIRYRHTPQPATVERLSDGRIKIVFDEPQRAITAGQSAVIYDGDTVIGGGIIE